MEQDHTSSQQTETSTESAPSKKLVRTMTLEQFLEEEKDTGTRWEVIKTPISSLKRQSPKPSPKK